MDMCKLGIYCIKLDYGNDKSFLIFIFFNVKNL